MRVFAIRPEPGLSSTIAVGAAHGLPITGFPLSRIAPCGWTLPELGGIDALLVGSANAFRHGGDKLEALHHLPVLAVGKTTAAAAEKAGFRVAASGTGGLQALLDTLEPGPRCLLRLAGEDHVPLQLPPGTELILRVVYRVQDTEISPEFENELRKGALILLHSAGAAQHFAQECDRLGLDRGSIALAALGPRILEPVGEGWLDARSASTPAEPALLALARDMCQ
ncbi:uroporphyrinogen-III synthase [Altererythrobacter sp. BO-6]|uniref:uroporphyrinogen-III synthase n=1 Tax=Altererythrobacter sp. BO-6 TaxID=2604537 RepID=UPI0013E1F0A4|nr:uroporphyrinogen-III synthase [Altererythrobacter sp. BO-6]QIG54960.1 uroporphyrinogen-III synthase [Altererythrobacter sp. BO-6]